MKLNQIIALVTGRKSKAQALLTSVYRGWKGERLAGISRSYQPLDEEGVKYPSEHRLVQLRVSEELKQVKKQLSGFMTLVATQEWSNTLACGTITVGQEAIASDVPVSILLFLEKQLIDFRTLASNLPTLPTDRTWTYDDGRNCYVASEEQTVKTLKTPTPIVKYEATVEHPAQVELINVDKVIGHWTAIHMSGACTVQERDEMIERIEKLQEAVKVAREEANGMTVTLRDRFTDNILDYVFNM